MELILPLIAQTSPAARTTFELGRLLNFGPLQWLLLILVSLAVVTVVVYFYLRDCVELGGAIASVLITLRLTAFAGLLWIYLLPQMRVETDHVTNSRVLVAVDTSLSMGKQDDSSSRRSDAVIQLLQQGELLQQLRRTHDVFVTSFDVDTANVATLAKLPAPVPGAPASQPAPEAPLDWARLLAPKGRETRLGHALRQLLSEHRAEPVSGIVLLTDGCHNAGVDPTSAVAQAREARIPIFPIGLGSIKKDVHLRVADFQVPARAYPGDEYSVSGLIQAWGLANQEVDVELLSREASAPPDAATVEQAESVTLGSDGEGVVIKFTLKPEEPGKRMLTLRVKPPIGDLKPGKELQDEKVIEIVDHKTRVLLFAGGPSREYSFLRPQLYRDESMIVDVLLQTAQPGVSQEANRILDDFPRSKEEMFQYDCIVAFDPDWLDLDENQIDLLENWVAKGAGGLIVIPGPVHTDNWVHTEKEQKLNKIRALYPVMFKRHFALLKDSDFDNKRPYPLQFSPEGHEAEHLWLGDAQIASQQTWNAFEGVYGYYDVDGPKSAATVYARYSNPDADDGDGLPVYFVGQFYGSGRVFYLGSGEMWRLRSLDVGHFETFYTKLIRYVSQGTLLRGSKRGMLLVEQDKYLLGDTVAVRAQLQDAQFEPLRVESVVLEVIDPAERLQSLALKPVPAQDGAYAGQFTVYQEGTYRLQLAVPESEETLTWTIDARLPDLENEKTQRNDALLSEIATATSGRYYPGLEAALDTKSKESLLASLADRKRTMTLAGKARTLWDNQWTLFFVCGVLCLEWLIRRLSKLA
jgi:hypothetical protein